MVYASVHYTMLKLLQSCPCYIFFDSGNNTFEFICFCSLHFSWMRCKNVKICVLLSSKQLSRDWIKESTYGTKMVRLLLSLMESSTLGRWTWGAHHRSIVNSVPNSFAKAFILFSFQTCVFVLSMFILHSRESEFHRYILDGTSALAWKLPFPRCLGYLSST